MGMPRFALVMVVVITIMIMMVMMVVAIAIGIVIVMFGVTRRTGVAGGIIGVAVKILVVVMIDFALEGERIPSTSEQRRFLTLQQLPHLFFLSFFQVQAVLGVAAAGSFALLQVFHLLPLQVLQLPSMTGPQLQAWVRSPGDGCNRCEGKQETQEGQ